MERKALLGFKHGKLCATSGKYTEAIEFFKNSLSIYQEKGDQEMIARCYNLLGACYRMLDKHSEAVTNYEQSLPIIVSLKLEKQLEGEVTATLVASLMNLNRFQEAKEYLDKALIIAKQIGGLKLEWFCNLTLSDLHCKQSEFNKALDYAERAEDIANRMNSTDEKQMTYRALGNALASLGRVKEAIDYLERYLEYTKQVGNRNEESRTFFKLSVCYEKIYEYDKAISYVKKSSDIAKETGDLNTEGKAYGAIGNALKKKGKVKEAMEYFKKELEIATQGGNKLSEAVGCNNLGASMTLLGKHYDAIRYLETSIKLNSELGCENNNGATYNNLGLLYKRVGKYRKAAKFLEQCLDIVKDTGKISIKISAYQNLSLVHSQLNKFNLEGECRWNSIIFAIRTGDKRGEINYFTDLGQCFRKTDKKTDAIKNYKKALHLAFKIKRSDRIGTCYMNLGTTSLKFGMVDEAIHAVDKGLNMCTDSGDKELEADCRRIMGMIYYVLAHNQKTCNDPVQYTRNIKTSEQYLRENIQWYEKLFDDLREKHEFKISIVDTYVEAYRQLALLLIDTNSITEALIVCERGRACALEDTLVCKYGMQQQQLLVENMSTRKPLNESDLTYLVPEESSLLFYSIIMDNDHMWVLSQQQSLIHTQDDMQKNSITNKNITKYIKQLVDSAYQFMGVRQMAANCEDRSLREQEPCYSEGDDDRSQLSNSITRRPLEHDIIDSEYSRRNPKERRINPPESTSTESDQHIDTNEPLKELFLITPVQEHLTQDEVIIIPDGSQNMEPCYSEGDDDRSQLSNSITRRTLEQDIIESEYSKRNPKKRTRNPPESTSIGSDQHIDTKEPLQELFKQLITPVQEQLTQDEIIIIPDGPLNMVPFAALTDPKTGRFFCETKRIRLAPSLTTLKILKECPDYHSKTGALVVGNPCVGKVIFRRKKTTISRLPGAEKEAQDIGQILNVSPLIGKDATKDAVKEKLQEDAAVIHIAAHGDDATGEIALAPCISAQSKAIPEEEDYILTMQEVQEIGVRAKLVVLSCCHSGRGEIRAEGVVGMARAFLAAGARAVVASLWAIDDEATLDFMCHFYRQLKLGESASVSLKNSMKKMIDGDGDGEEKRYSNPEYWAPFFLIGDDVTIYKVNDRSVDI